MHEIRRCLHRYDGIEAPLKRVPGRIRVPVLLLGWTPRFEFDAGVRDVSLESAHAIYLRLRERDRVIESRLVDPGEPPILKTARVHDGLGSVIAGWQSCKHFFEISRNSRSTG